MSELVKRVRAELNQRERLSREVLAYLDRLKRDDPTANGGWSFETWGEFGRLVERLPLSAPEEVLSDARAKQEILADHTTPHTVVDGFCVEEGGECTHAGEERCQWHGTDDCATVRSLEASLGV